MDNVLRIDDLKAGLPGVTQIQGGYCAECIMVCLHRAGHTEEKCVLHVDCIKVTEDFQLLWTDSYNDQIDRSHADEQITIEHAAEGISILLSLRLTPYTVVQRSRKGTGFDYWLGIEANTPSKFELKARLEVSGIRSETEANSLEKRFKVKCNQVTPTDDTGFPAYISVVEFSNPKAKFAKK